MKQIILLRHFRVKDSYEKKLFSSAELDEWVDLYDTYDLDYHNVSFEPSQKVYTSALSRAKRTADYLGLNYKEDAIFNEVSTKAFIKTSWRFPKFLWLVIGKILWQFNLMKLSESKKEVLQRASAAADIIIDSKEETIMIVSHGFFMLVLVRELKKRGFLGKIDKHPQNGKIYTFLKA